MTVYLLHFNPPYKRAKHYIGYTSAAKADRRVQEHVKGTSKTGPLIRAAIAAGCEIQLAHVWPEATRQFERKLKNRKDTPQWCPCCEKKQRVPEYKA